MARAEKLKARQEQEERDLWEKVKDDRTGDVDMFDLRREDTASSGAPSSIAMGIDLGGVSREYDDTIRSLTPDGETQVKYSRLWREMTDEQKAEFKRRVIDEGIVTEEAFELVHQSVLGVTAGARNLFGNLLATVAVIGLSLFTHSVQCRLKIKGFCCLFRGISLAQFTRRCGSGQSLVLCC